MLGWIALLPIPTGQVDRGPVSSGIRLQTVWGQERCCKSRRQLGQF
jgi:hypothetical protein